MEIRNVEVKDYNELKELFKAYYAELDCEDDPDHLFAEYVLPDFEAGLLSIAVACLSGGLAGFIIYQVDDVINDWCFKEGAGDLRELFVLPEKRRRGIGSALIKFAEAQLLGGGAETVYTLPTEESEGFFGGHGYADCGGYCAELDNKVFEKTLSAMDKTDIK